MTTGGLDPDPPDPGARVDVEAIRARADAATPGPWERQPSLSMDSCVESRADSTPDLAQCSIDVCGDRPREDAAFIAHARADVPALCDALTHERRVSAIWRDLTLARISPAAAFAQLRAIGIDPEAP